MNHQLYSPQVDAGIFSMKFSDLIPRVPERAQRVQGLWKSEFPVKASPLTSRRTRMEMTELYAHADTLSCFMCAFSTGFSLHNYLTQTVTKLNPMFGRGIPQSSLELAAQPMWECAPPSLPPSSFPFSTVCVDHPETGSSLFVFLKKGPYCLSFPLNHAPRTIHSRGYRLRSIPPLVAESNPIHLHLCN